MKMYDSVIEVMNFPKAFGAALKGDKIQRNGWNGKGLYVEVTDVVDPKGVSHKTTMITYPNGDSFLWQPSPTDLVAEDWLIIE